MKELLPALIALGGIITGGILQYTFSRIAEKRKSFEKLQSDAYLDFVRCVAERTMAQRFGDKNVELMASALLADANTRIGIYGDSRIAKQVGAFFEYHADLSKKENMIAFVNLITNIRTKVLGKATEEDWMSLSQILFSENLKS